MNRTQTEAVKAGQTPPRASIIFLDTPEKLRPLAEEAAEALSALLRELAAMEDKSFAQYTRLCRQGRAVEFRDGQRREFTAIQAWKEENEARFAAFLDPHCTQKLISQRRGCLHAAHFPSSFSCLNAGCELAVTAKSGTRAVIWLTPDGGSVPFDLSNPDVRYLVEGMKCRGHGAVTHSFFEKFRFTLKREGEDWRLDEVFVSSLHEDRWRRDFYF